MIFFKWSLSLDRCKNPKKMNIFSHVLFNSHGYPGLIYLQKNSREKTLDKYPCNLNIINRSIGIITHSDHTINLEKKMVWI